MATNGSPLKDSPLRNPGQGLDERIQHLLDEKVFSYLWYAGGLTLLALMEWVGYLTNMPRRPWLFSATAILVIAWAAWRIIPLRTQIRHLKQGRDGERVVGQFLERLRAEGAHVFHDVQGDDFNLDHVVVCRRGIFVVETKTLSKPHSRATIRFEGENIFVAGRLMDPSPIIQVRAQVAWLTRMLSESTGRTFTVKGSVVFPGWFVEPPAKGLRPEPWVLSARALPAFIDHEPERLKPDEVALASYHLSRFIRTAHRSCSSVR
jgi:hypothetical protein